MLHVNTCSPLAKQTLSKRKPLTSELQILGSAKFSKKASLVFSGTAGPSRAWPAGSGAPKCKKVISVKSCPRNHQKAFGFHCKIAIGGGPGAAQGRPGGDWKTGVKKGPFRAGQGGWVGGRGGAGRAKALDSSRPFYTPRSLASQWRRI